MSGTEREREHEGMSQDEYRKEEDQIHHPDEAENE